MKTKGLWIALLLTYISLTGYSQDNFDRLANNRDISVVTITKALFNLMPNVDGPEGLEINQLKDKLDRMDIFNADKESSVKTIKNFARLYLTDQKNYEILMRVREEAEETIFYVERGKGEQIKSFIMYVEEENECTLIRLLGNFTMEDVQNVTAKIK